MSGADEAFGLGADAARTEVAIQLPAGSRMAGVTIGRLLATGGGACNDFLIAQLREVVGPQRVVLEVPSIDIVQYKEALIMGFMAVLRWRQEYTVLSSVTGASRDSIGGALWTGQEA
jgi:1,6-anhydro-N-acetylmuramate kinase